MAKLRIPDIEAVLNRARDVAVQASEDQLRRFAHQLRDQFVGRIRAQDFDSFRRVPLSWRWQNRKAALHLDERTMIATGEYLRSIQVFETRADGKLNLRIGIHPSKIVRHYKTGMRRRLPMWLLACVHEFGSSRAKVPARPHWGPFFQDVQQNVAPRTARELTQAVGRKVRASVGGHR
ncbi:MAG: hypothetical protein BWY85_00079 [Firmicutes bacterium ADurb.Bin506]|nr:MAG: hypothetical protein BWY85_00079 [Firmicutes bacterium ADurb.Bin506]